jgi:hypothetical protein
VYQWFECKTIASNENKLAKTSTITTAKKTKNNGLVL